MELAFIKLGRLCKISLILYFKIISIWKISILAEIIILMINQVIVNPIKQWIKSHRKFKKI